MIPMSQNPTVQTSTRYKYLPQPLKTRILLLYQKAHTHSQPITIYSTRLDKLKEINNTIVDLVQLRENFLKLMNMVEEIRNENITQSDSNKGNGTQYNYDLSLNVDSDHKYSVQQTNVFLNDLRLLIHSLNQDDRNLLGNMVELVKLMTGRFKEIKRKKNDLDE